MIHFPTNVIDNFCDNPDEVVKMAQSDKIEWHKHESGNWPGMRSQPLHILDKEFWANMIKKYLNVFWTNDEMNSQDIRFEASSFFQRISSEYTNGWIHSDFPDVHTTILYLTPNADPKSGTAIYMPRNINTQVKHTDMKQKYYRGEISKEEQQPYLEEHNKGFIEDCFFANKYNRQIGFDSRLWHGVKEFDTNTKEERLTIVTFIHKVIAHGLPMNRMRNVPLTRDLNLPQLDIV
jgi:hypothetical protein